MRHIIVVGGSHAGLATTHQILKQAIKQSLHDFKITLISRETHFFWNIAIPRGLIPGQYTDEELFHPIEPGFTQYSQGIFQFLLAHLTKIDAQNRHVKVVDDNGRETSIQYDYLILATGSQTLGQYPWKSLGSYEATKTALHSLQSKVRSATTIAVIGAGPTGISIAGELSCEYGTTKNIVLISRESTILHDRPNFVSVSALTELERLGVVVKFGCNIVSNPVDGSEILLAKGEKFQADLYLPTYGQRPNTHFLSSESLDKHGYVRVGEHLDVLDLDNVFAIGDMSNMEPPQFIFLDRQAIYMAKNVIRWLKGENIVPYSPITKPMIGLTIGKQNGVGHWGNWRIPSFLIMYKKKVLFIDQAPRVVDGSHF